MYSHISEDSKLLSKAVDEYREVFPDLEEKEKGKINKKIDEFQVSADNFRLDFRKISEGFIRWHHNFETLGQTDWKPMHEFREDFQEGVEGLEKYRDFYEQLTGFTIQMKDEILAKRCADLDSEISKLEKLIVSSEEGNEKENYRASLDSVKMQKQLYQTMRELDPSNFTGMFLIKLRLIEAETKELSTLDSIAIGNPLSEPNEIMARVLKATARLYFGPVSRDFYTPTDEDLDFLGRFKYKGKKLFDKIVARYRVGKQMVKNGYEPEKVREMLQYATSFEYGGEKYSWPDANFTIKGDIPYDKNADSRKSLD